MYEEICLESYAIQSQGTSFFEHISPPWEGVENVQSYCSVFSFTSIIVATGWRDGVRCWLEISNAFLEEENSFVTSFSRIFADSPTVLSLSKV